MNENDNTYEPGKRKILSSSAMGSRNSSQNLEDFEFQGPLSYPELVFSIPEPVHLMIP